MASTNLYGMNDFYRSGPHEADSREERSRYRPTGDEPECCIPDSATSEANREQEARSASNIAWRERLEATR